MNIDNEPVEQNIVELGWKKLVISGKKMSNPRHQLILEASKPVYMAGFVTALEIIETIFMSDYSHDEKATAFLRLRIQKDEALKSMLEEAKKL